MTIMRGILCLLGPGHIVPHGHMKRPNFVAPSETALSKGNSQEGLDKSMLEI